MDDIQRHDRLRLLVKNLNRERKKQAKQIDILCNDFVAAQKDFVRKLNTARFTARFYEAILGSTDLGNLLYTAVALIKEDFGEANITFFLRDSESFEIHMFENDAPISFGKTHIENSFTPEVMDSICKSNKVCTLGDMFAMGLTGNPAWLNRISAMTIPLGLQGSSLGFILVYCSSECKLDRGVLANVNSVAAGLSKAIHSCQGSLRATD